MNSVELVRIIECLNKLGIVNNYIINDDGTIDVKDNVCLCHKSLTSIPVQFGVVHGDFDCSFNRLKTLKGSPKFVKGNFNCSNNLLVSLYGAPQYVEGSFYCHDNQLTSLNNITKKINGILYCYNNKKIFDKEEIQKACSSLSYARIFLAV